ncbi:phosphoribosyltransferase [Pendulispora brunnea]|uniref:Phosphoribosyltransferase n=1 Tax=Pendulispora brunnea TaxID=2905690 RepID=A0ABZ2KAF7_9BACT
MASPRLFRTRQNAGRELGFALRAYEAASPLVLGIPPGGVPVAFEVARALGAPLDVWAASKVRVPLEPELGIGAVAEGDEVFLDLAMVAALRASRLQIDALVAKTRDEVADQRRRLEMGRERPVVRGKTVILVDDGVATGNTAPAALRALKRCGAQKRILALPVAAYDVFQSLRNEADDLVCLEKVANLEAVGLWYHDAFSCSDEDVIGLLQQAHELADGSWRGQPAFDAFDNRLEPGSRR